MNEDERRIAHQWFWCSVFLAQASLGSRDGKPLAALLDASDGFWEACDFARARPTSLMLGTRAMMGKSVPDDPCDPLGKAGRIRTAVARAGIATYAILRWAHGMSGADSDDPALFGLPPGEFTRMIPDILETARRRWVHTPETSELTHDMMQRLIDASRRYASRPVEAPRGTEAAAENILEFEFPCLITAGKGRVPKEWGRGTGHVPITHVSASEAPVRWHLRLGDGEIPVRTLGDVVLRPLLRPGTSEPATLDDVAHAAKHGAWWDNPFLPRHLARATIPMGMLPWDGASPKDAPRVEAALRDCLRRCDEIHVIDGIAHRKTVTPSLNLVLMKDMGASGHAETALGLAVKWRMGDDLAQTDRLHPWMDWGLAPFHAIGAPSREFCPDIATWLLKAKDYVEWPKHLDDIMERYTTHAFEPEQERFVMDLAARMAADLVHPIPFDATTPVIDPPMDLLPDRSEVEGMGDRSRTVALAKLVEASHYFVDMPDGFEDVPPIYVRNYFYEVRSLAGGTKQATAYDLERAFSILALPTLDKAMTDEEDADLTALGM